jgi:serine/threonine-protein kinase
MAKCSSCLTELPANVRFCSSCGVPVGNTDDVATLDFATATSPLPARPPSSSSSRSSKSGEYLLNEARFLPGRLLLGRYRIIALLGKGGMGEVYRADDLTLGQSVAMKFLPDEAGHDVALLERFRNEVRIARRVSHPNVCRVYDVGDVDSQTFFTMEYVDGEDLASLLRRIGRLPPDKALEIARQLCAGLAAAHTKGVLHRDLKPANIMLDGRGQVVITDFGLAGVADDIRGMEVRSGTPAYMAPEQLAGKEVSTHSDIYALGLVLYEVFTGKRAFAESSAELVRTRGDRTPSRPSSVVKDLDPAVEKVILRCLETEPGSRPATALAVAAALPGGDPLAAALAAGETPSPQLVAASGDTTGLSPRTAVACLVAVLAGLALSVFLMIRYNALELMHLEQPPEVLAQKAREIEARLGYAERPADSAVGFDYDTDLSDYVENNQKKPNWNEVLAGRPSILKFWYRQSPKYMSASGYYDLQFTPGVLQEDDPPTVISGMINIELDPKGRLTNFQAIPPQKAEERTAAGPPDWAPLFAAAEIDPAKLQPAQPQWNSLATADVRSAWTGTWPGTSFSLRVEAAAWHGKPVYFALIGDWTKPSRMVTTDSSADRHNKLSQVLFLLLLTSLLVAGALLARRNYRQGRADREGALRLATVMFGLEVLLWVCRSHIVANFDTFGRMMLCVAAGLLTGGITWMLYLALEPWIRRRWPHAIISWSRALAGQLRDPLVGRDILFGVIFGVVWLLIIALDYIPLARAGAAPQLSTTAYLLGVREALGRWLLQIPTSILATLEFFFIMLGLKVVLRKDWLAALAFVAMFVGLKGLQSSHPLRDLPVIVPIYALLVVVVFRFGLVPLVVAVFTVDMLASVPFTADLSAWYASATVFALLSVVALAGWGFYHSLSGKPIWKMEME